MRKILLSFFYLILFCFFLSIPQQASAIWAVRTTPITLYSNTPAATFTIHSDTDVLEPAPAQYGFYVYKAGDGNTSIQETPITGIFKTGDGHTVTISNIPIRDAFTPGAFGSGPGSGVVGAWRIAFCKLRLVLGGIPGNQHIACENTLLETNVQVFPPGSSLGLPAIQTNGKTFKSGVSVEVKIKNVALNTPYSIWWRAPDKVTGVVFHTTGFTTAQPLEGSPSQPTATVSIPPPIPGVYNLCMTPNNPPFGNSIIGLNCDYSIIGMYITNDDSIVQGSDHAPVISNEAGLPGVSSSYSMECKASTIRNVTPTGEDVDDPRSCPSGTSCYYMDPTNGIINCYPTPAMPRTIPTEGPAPATECDRYVNPTTGLIMTTPDPSLPRICAPNSAAPCAKYVNPTTREVLPTTAWNSAAYKECVEVNTAIGNIAINTTGFVKSLFGVLLGVSGGIAMLLIISSGYRLIASQGDPTKVQGARETITSAVVGLLFIILSLVILEVIGVDILKIPGLSP